MHQAWISTAIWICIILNATVIIFTASGKCITIQFDCTFQMNLKSQDMNECSSSLKRTIHHYSLHFVELLFTGGDNIQGRQVELSPFTTWLFWLRWPLIQLEKTVWMSLQGCCSCPRSSNNVQCSRRCFSGSSSRRPEPMQSPIVWCNIAISPLNLGIEKKEYILY